MKTSKINARCPLCRTHVHRATHEDDGTPEAGDYNICAHCRCLSIFTAKLSLRLPTKAEGRAILADAETMTALQAAGGKLVELVERAQQQERESN